MILDEALLSNLMYITYIAASGGFVGKQVKDDFDIYSKAVINGIKTGTATAMTTGLGGGPPGTGKIIGCINPGPPFMLPFLIPVMMPAVGAPTPLQLTYALSISQIATHLLTNLQSEALPLDTVSAGQGVVTPGGIIVVGSAIAGLIIAEVVKTGNPPTPQKIAIAKAIGNATEQLMKATSVIIPIIGAPVGSPPPPMAGSRSVIFS